MHTCASFGKTNGNFRLDFDMKEGGCSGQSGLHLEEDEMNKF